MLREQSNALSLQANEIRLTRICGRYASSCECSLLSRADWKRQPDWLSVLEIDDFYVVSTQDENGIRSRVTGSAISHPQNQDTSELEGRGVHTAATRYATQYAIRCVLSRARRLSEQVSRSHWSDTISDTIRDTMRFIASSTFIGATASRSHWSDTISDTIQGICRFAVNQKRTKACHN
jgi:hypothetical protein